MSVPKNQHYIPQFYLKGFTNPQAEGQLQVLAKGQTYWRRSGVSKVAAKDFMYSGKDRSGQWNHRMETDVLSRLETQFKPVLAKLLKQQQLNATESLTFAYFVTTTWQRVPSEIDRMNDFRTRLATAILQMHSEHPEDFERWKAEQREKGDMQYENMRAEDLSPSRYKLTSVSAASFKDMLAQSQKIVQIILRMGWMFLMAQGTDCFICSDHPFCIIDPTRKNFAQGVGLIHGNAEISLPLSRKMAFVAGWKSGGRHFIPVPHEMVAMTCTLKCRPPGMLVLPGG